VRTSSDIHTRCPILNIFCRYGAFFATHVFGSPTIYATTPDAAKYFLADAQRLMKPGYPPSVEAIQDPTRVMDGALHSRIRKTLQPSLGPDALHRTQFISFTDSVARETLRSWEGRVVNTHDEMRKVSCLLHLYWVFLRWSAFCR